LKSKSLLVLISCALILCIVLSAFMQPVMAGDWFTSGFENPLGNDWTTLYRNGQIPVIDSSVQRSGASSIRFSTNPTLAEAYSVIRKTLDNSFNSSIYASGDFLISKPLLNRLGSNDRFYSIRLYSSDTLVAMIGLRREGTDPLKWCLWQVGGERTYSPLTLSTAIQWTNIRLLWNSAGGTCKVWINGALEISTSGISGVQKITSIDFGIIKSGSAGVFYDPTTQYACTVNLDNALISPGPSSDWFTSDFEQPLQATWASSYSNGLMPVLDSTASRSGTLSAKFQTNPTLNAAYSTISKPLNGNFSSIICASGYFSVSAPQLALLGNNDRFNVIRIMSSTNQVVALGLRREGSQPLHWALWKYGGLSSYGVSEVNSVPKWTSITLYCNRVSGNLQVWINGRLEISSNITNMPVFTSIEFGINKAGLMGASYDPTTTYTCTVNLDDVTLSSQTGPPAAVMPPPSVPPFKLMGANLLGWGDVPSAASLLKSSGANSVRVTMVSKAFPVSSWLVNLKSQLDANGIKLIIGTMGINDWEFSFSQGSQLQSDIITNVNGKGDSWRSDWSKIIQTLQPYAIDVMNEPIKGPNSNGYTPTLEDYKFFVQQCIQSWRSVKSDLVIIVPNYSYFDPYTIDIYIDQPNIVYSYHDYYAYNNQYPQVWQQWAREYWNGSLTTAKSLFQQKILKDMGALINASREIVWEEGGTNYLNPHADAYLQDWYSLCKQYNIGISTAFLEPYPRSVSGMLNSDCTTLNYMGQIWAANMPKT
jgi:hypothetical protein